MLFTRNTQTGTITVDAWEPEIDISGELLEAMSTDIGIVDGNMLRLRVANGTADYQIVGPGKYLYSVHAVLVARTWEET